MQGLEIREYILQVLDIRSKLPKQLVLSDLAPNV